MKTEQLKRKLLYIEEHLSCQNYMTSIETGFKYLNLNKGAKLKEDATNKNYLLFFLEGDFTINCNLFKNRAFHTGEMVLIPRSSKLKVVANTNSELVSLFFDVPKSSCDKLALQSLAGICKNINYDFAPTKMHYPLFPFLEVLTHCIKNGMNCFHFHDLMQREFFCLLRGFYEKQEIASLFYPIIGVELNFKDFVMQNYMKVDNIEQLIALSNIGRSGFFTKFNEVFGMTAKQWLLKQKNQRILEELTKPGVCIKDVIEDLGFYSQAYFTRYCKQHFGCTPKQLIERCQAKME